MSLKLRKASHSNNVTEYVCRRCEYNFLIEGNLLFPHCPNCGEASEVEVA